MEKAPVYVMNELLIEMVQGMTRNEYLSWTRAPRSVFLLNASRKSYACMCVTGSVISMTVPLLYSDIATREPRFY
jgi:hypothetical protein